MKRKPPATKLVLATRNAAKLTEMRRILRPLLPGVRMVSLTGFPAVPLPEEGDTFEENARSKALAAARLTGCVALADDSGLEVEALGGAPGVHSSRFAGPGDEDRTNEVLRLTRDVPPQKRRAKFVCAAAVATPDGKVKVVRAECRGHITREPRGRGGFGYDPIFVHRGCQRTFAQITRREKDMLSHRGKALRRAAALVRKALAQAQRRTR